MFALGYPLCYNDDEKRIMRIPLKSLPTKRFPKKEREKKVLFGLTKLFIQSGKPIGSNTLREEGFEDLSSATIRNYFANLEKEGYLEQEHSSGGRKPTEKAFREYALFHLNTVMLDESSETKLRSALLKETKELSDYLNYAVELLSEILHLPVLLFPPKFEMDFIQAVKLFPISQEKVLILLVTDFGMIRTEIFYPPFSLTPDDLSQVEEYIYWRMEKGEKPLIEDPTLERWAQRLYSEIMVRHFIASSSVSPKYVGVSKLLNYPEFYDSELLATGLRFFEENRANEYFEKSLTKNELLFWMGKEIDAEQLSLISIPYSIGPTPVGAIAVLGPLRMPYPFLFGILRAFSRYVSDSLTKSAYTFQISFGNAPTETNPSILLENKGKSDEGTK